MVLCRATAAGGFALAASHTSLRHFPNQSLRLGSVHTLQTRTVLPAYLLSQNAALQAHRVTMYSQMQHLRQQLHLDVHRQHRRLQQLLQEQQILRQQGQDAGLDAQICPVKRQMAVVLGGVDDTVRRLLPSLWVVAAAYKSAGQQCNVPA